MRILRRILLAVLALVALLWAGLAVYAYWPVPAVTAPARELAGPADRFVMVDGMELRYRSFGARSPGRPALVLVHGFANSLQSFRLLAPLLAADFHVVTPDVPGFGLSAKPATHDYGNASQARVIADFAAALGLEHYIVGGHSMGGTLAVYVAASDPHVTGLVLLNPGIITTGVPAFMQHPVWPLPRVMARLFATTEFRASSLRRAFLNPALVTAPMIADVMLAARSTDYLDGMTALMSQYRTGEEPAMAHRVHVPTLIVWGKQDRSKPAGEAEAVRALIAGARLVTVPQAGHYVHEEQPAAVATAITAAARDWRGQEGD